MIERCFQRAFGVNVYYAVCHQCGCWLTSSVGQFGWTQRHQRNQVADAHMALHQRMAAA